MPRGRQGLTVDIALTSTTFIQGAVRAHITWPGVDPERPKSSLITITLYDIGNNAVKVCGGKRKINVRVPSSLEYAIDSHTLSTTDVAYVLNEIKRIVLPASGAGPNSGDPALSPAPSADSLVLAEEQYADSAGAESSSVMQSEVARPPQKHCSTCAVDIHCTWPHGSCPGPDICTACFVRAVDAACTRANTFLGVALTCSSCMAVLEHGYVHAILATIGSQDAISVSLRYAIFFNAFVRALLFVTSLNVNLFTKVRWDFIN
jgi:hypothetical protein